MYRLFTHSHQCAQHWESVGGTFTIEDRLGDTHEELVAGRKQRVIEKLTQVSEWSGGGGGSHWREAEMEVP